MRPYQPAILAVAALCSGLLPAANAQSSSIVISQIYGGGGNSGAALRNDFIELFNRGTQRVTITGWSVQYASASGSSWDRTILSGTIQPRGEVVVKLWLPPTANGFKILKSGP